jgi:cytochrome c oxidase subunit 1
MATVGAFTIALSVLLFIINVVRAQLKPAGLENEDPWDARTLEWTTACPPPVYNFEEIPTVHSLDEFWHRKYAEDETGRLVRVPAGGSGEAHPGGGHAIHLPSPSYWPIVVSLGFPMLGYGVLYYSWGLIAAGALVIVVGLTAWALEPSVAE